MFYSKGNYVIIWQLIGTSFLLVVFFGVLPTWMSLIAVFTTKCFIHSHSCLSNSNDMPQIYKISLGKVIGGFSVLICLVKYIH